MNKIQLIFTALIFFIGCKKDNETISKSIEPPKGIAIISGNNQKGYPYEPLNDSILIKITANKSEYLTKYSYHFKISDIRVSIPSRAYIIGNDLYISASWQLNSKKDVQELKFYLTENCNVANNSVNCKIIDSLIIKALIKQPWTNSFPGDSWPLYDMHFSDENTAIVIGDLPFSTGYLKTTNGGLTWDNVNNRRKDLYKLSFCDKDTGIVIVTNNYAYYTSNGGQSFYTGEWTPPFIGHLSSSDYFMLSSKKIVTVGRNGAIAKSVDAGKSWETYKGFTFTNALYSVTCPSNEIWYACGEIGKVVKTIDGGETWFEENVLLNNYLKIIYFLDNDFGFAGGEKGALIRTTDGGKNWNIISTGLKFTIIEIYFTSKDIGYIVSSVGEISKTDDGGKTWHQINKDNYGVYSLNNVCFQGNIIWGLQGGSIYKYDLRNE